MKPFSAEELARLLDLEEHGQEGKRLNINALAKALGRACIDVADVLHEHGRRIGRGHNLGRSWRPRGHLDHNHLASEPESCRWVEGDPRNVTYCQADKKPGSDYCAHHHSIAYVPAANLGELRKIIKWATAQ